MNTSMLITLVPFLLGLVCFDFILTLIDNDDHRHRHRRRRRRRRCTMIEAPAATGCYSFHCLFLTIMDQGDEDLHETNSKLIKRSELVHEQRIDSVVQ
jgi:hypothetical protein